MFQVEKSEYGEIKFVLPKVDTMLELMHHMGADPSKLHDAEYMTSHQFLFLANIIKNMDKFVTNVDLMIDDQPIKTLSEARENLNCMKMLIDVANKLLSSLNMDSKKKQS